MKNKIQHVPLHSQVQPNPTSQKTVANVPKKHQKHSPSRTTKLLIIALFAASFLNLAFLDAHFSPLHRYFRVPHSHVNAPRNDIPRNDLGPNEISRGAAGAEKCGKADEKSTLGNGFIEPRNHRVKEQSSQPCDCNPMPRLGVQLGPP